jgi:hypothetical protein
MESSNIKNEANHFINFPLNLPQQNFTVNPDEGFN